MIVDKYPNKMAEGMGIDPIQVLSCPKFSKLEPYLSANPL